VLALGHDGPARYTRTLAGRSTKIVSYSAPGDKKTRTGEKAMTKRAVLYASVTVCSERLGKRLLAEQLEVCREYAAAHGLEIVAELAEDRRGRSSARRGRPQLKRAF
jgi:hypothetical protein